MEKIYLCDESYDNYIADKPMIGSGYESKVYSFGKEVLKIFESKFQNCDTEERVSNLANIEGLDEVLTVPTKSVYLNMNFIGCFMNYAGVDLKKYLRENDLTFEEKVKIITSIKNRLLFLHKFDIVHGDLQPKNIMFYSGIVKISDVVNIRFGNYQDALLNDMTLYLAKYFGITSLLDLHSLNYITHILLNTKEEEMLEYIDMDADGCSYLRENGYSNHVFLDEVFEEQMDILLNPKKNQHYALEKSKYLIDYVK